MNMHTKYPNKNKHFNNANNKTLHKKYGLPTMHNGG